MERIGLPSALTDALHAVRVLTDSGLLDLRRPDRAIGTYRDARRWGALAAPVRVAARAKPDAIGLVDELGALTFAELDHRSDALCAAWRDRGLDETAVIGLLCRGHRGMVDAAVAAGKLGARIVLMNTGFAGPQLRDVCGREGVTVLVYDAEYEPAVAEIGETVQRYLAWVDGDSTTPQIEDLIRACRGRRVAPPAAPGVIVLLTSGTTGLPKGAPRQVKSIHVVVQLLDRIPLRAGEATYLAAPVFHATGLAHLILAFGLGSTVVLPRRFDAEATLAGIAAHRCTAAILVPTMLQRIVDLDAAVRDRYDVSALRILFCAGSILTPTLAARATETFGEVVYNLYGSTEVAVAAVANPADLAAAPGTVGRSPHGVVVRLFDDQGSPVSQPGATGRIFVANGSRFEGYTDGQTKPMIDGLMSSGDVGHFDDAGRLFIDGRDDDMIVSGGENVFPAEVEELLDSHDAITEACVIGVPDPEFGQRLVAYVVARNTAAISADDVRKLVRANLARHKIPREVVFIPALPRNDTGKVLRAKLAARNGHPECDQ